MEKYIDAEKLKAEIDKKWRELADKNVKVGGGKYDIEISTCLSIINLITSLQQEQHEADLEKEIDRFWDSCIKHKDERGGNVIWCNKLEIEALARYFAEWGAIHFNARKEE